MTTKREILERLAPRMSEIRKLGVEKLGLFGSFQRDQGTATSDIDFVVHFRPDEKTYTHLFALSQLLQNTLGRKIELVTPESLDPGLRKRILEDIEYVEGPDDIHRPYSR